MKVCSLYSYSQRQDIVFIEDEFLWSSSANQNISLLKCFTKKNYEPMRLI